MSAPGVSTASSRSVLRIGTFTSLGAAVTFGALLLAGRELGPRNYAHFMVIWGVFFAASGLWQGLQQEMTRELATSGPADARAGRSVLAASAGLGAVGAAVFVALFLLWGEPALGLGSATSVVLGVGLFGYAVVSGLNAALSAAGEWHLYGSVLFLESVIRAAVLVAALALTAAAAAQAAALASGTLAWVLISGHHSARRAFRARLTSRRGFGSRVAQAIGATACSVLVVSGFPILLQLTSSEPLGEDAGVLLAVLVVTRAPVLLLVTALQGVVLTRLIAAADQRLQVLRAWVRVIGISLAPVSVVGFLVGPSLIQVVFGDHYDTTGSAVVGLILGAGAVLMLTLTGWTTLAAGRHLTNLAGWATALLTTVVLLMMPGSVETRSIAALVGGPVLGAVVHLTQLRRGR